MAIPAHLNDHPIFNGSAWGAMSGEAPRFSAEEQPTHENLVNHLRQRGVKFEETHGRYGDPERSVLIYKPTRELMSELGKKFGQESVVYSNGGKHELLYTNGEHEGKSRLTKPGHEPIDWHDEAPDDYYSYLPNHGYFTVNFDFDREPEFQGAAPVCPECRTATKGDFCHQCGARQWSGPAPVQKSEAYARSPIMRLKKAWPKNEKENQANAASHAVMEDAILEQGGTKQEHPGRWEPADPMATASVSSGQGWNRCRACGTDFEMDDPVNTLCPDCDTYFAEEGIAPENAIHIIPHFTTKEPAIPFEREFAQGDKAAQVADQSYWSDIDAATDRAARFATAFPALSGTSHQTAAQMPHKAEMRSAWERSPVFNKKLQKARPPHEINQVLADQLQEQGFQPAEIPTSVGPLAVRSSRGQAANFGAPDWNDAITHRTAQQFNRLIRPNEQQQGTPVESGAVNLPVDANEAGYFAERQAIHDIASGHLSRDKDDPNFGDETVHFHNMPGVRDADDLGPELNREVGLPHPHAYEWHDGHTEHHLSAPNPTIVKSQKLDKMAIADLEPGQETQRGPAPHTRNYEYSHLLTPEQRNAGYRITLEHNHQHGSMWHDVEATLHHNHKYAGSLSAFAEKPLKYGERTPLEVSVAEIDDPVHHNKGLGRALYEAVYAHAFHRMGIREVKGDIHSTMAHRVHVSLAKKHGLDYVGQQRAAGRFRPGAYDNRYAAYSYALKSELEKGWPKDEKENQANAASHAVMEDAWLEQGAKKTIHRQRKGPVAALRDRALEIMNTCRHPDHGMSPCEPDSGHGHPFVAYRPPQGYPDARPWSPQPMPKAIAAEHWQEVDKDSSDLAKNAQVAPVGVSSYAQFAGPYGSVQAGQPSDLMHYPYHGKMSEVAELVKRHGYRTYFAGGKYGKPDLQAKNYDTGHLMIYDPTPQSGGDFNDHQYTNAWRQMHELAHALTHKEVNSIYGEGRRMGKLGAHRTMNEAMRAVHWEWLAAHKQRELNAQIGIHVPDETFHKELNTVMHDAVHRAVTGKFTEPSSEGFVPHSHKVPLHIALDTVRQHAEAMGLQHPHAKLQKGWPKDEKENQVNAASHAVMEDAWLEQGAKKTIHRGASVKALRNRALGIDMNREFATRNEQEMRADVTAPVMPSQYHYQGGGYDTAPYMANTNRHAEGRNTRSVGVSLAVSDIGPERAEANDKAYWQNIDSASTDAAKMKKALPPHETNQVLADQLQEQGFKPTKGYSTKQGLGTRLNAVKINHPPELPERGNQETLEAWQARTGGVPNLFEIRDQRYGPVDDDGSSYHTRDPGRLEPAQFHATQFNPRHPTAKDNERVYWKQVGKGAPVWLGPGPEPTATAAQIPTKTEMTEAMKRSPVFKRKGQ